MALSTPVTQVLITSAIRLRKILHDKSVSGETKFFNLIGFGLSVDATKIFLGTSALIQTLNILVLCISLGSASVKDMELLAEEIHMLIYFCATCTAALLLIIRGDKIRFLLYDVRDYFDYGPTMEDTIRELKSSSDLINTRILKFYGTFWLITFAISIIAPFSFSQNSSHLPYPLPNTFHITTSHQVDFALMFSLQLIGLIFCYFLLIGYSTLVMTTAIKVDSQVQLLNRALSSIIDRSQKHLQDFVLESEPMMTPIVGQYRSKEIREKRIILSCLNQCIQHHMAVIRMYDAVQSIYVVIYFMTVFGCLWAICLSGVLLVLQEQNVALMLKFALYAVLELLILFSNCWSGDLIRAAGESVRDGVYTCPWQDLPIYCQQSLRIMMTRTVKPLQVRTITGHAASLQVFTSILNLSYTYFNMILATRRK